MVYILATTEKTLRWYSVTLNQQHQPEGFTLHRELDLDIVTQFDDKKTAAKYAALLGLKTWRYVLMK